MKNVLKILIAGLAMAQVTACSKTVEWEEEVPLNTGEVIWVKRRGSYEFESQAGNPLKFAYRPQWRSTIEFAYKGKRYSHTDDAKLVLLAIAPDGKPNLVAAAGNWGSKHKYFCVTPYYVQFRPDITGARWVWPERIDSWLYGLPTNLVFGLAPLSADGAKFTAEDRVQRNASATVASREFRSIDPTYQYDYCLRRN